MKIQSIIQNIDNKKAFQLLYYVIGLYFMYLIWGFQLEKITTTFYSNQNSQAYFNIHAGIIFIEKIVVYLCGLLYKKQTMQEQEKVQIPLKNSLIIGSLLYSSQIAYFSSITMISYLFVIMSKSCSILNVILIAVFCTRLKTKQLKLGQQKIKIAIILTFGLILFKVCDPNFSLDQGNFQLLGIFLLLVSLFADGFIVDFQAQVKQKYRPAPIEMLIQYNKYCAIFAFIHLVLSGQVGQLINFLFSYPNFSFDALCFSFTGFFGQLFVFKIANRFKQHMVPLLMATRRIITIIFSIIYFEHQTSFGQIIGMGIVFFVVIYEVLDAITSHRQGQQGKEQKPKKMERQMEMIQIKFNEHLQDSTNSTTLRSALLLNDPNDVKEADKQKE